MFAYDVDEMSAGVTARLNTEPRNISGIELSAICDSIARKICLEHPSKYRSRALAALRAAEGVGHAVGEVHCIHFYTALRPALVEVANVYGSDCRGWLLACAWLRSRSITHSALPSGVDALVSDILP